MSVHDYWIPRDRAVPRDYWLFRPGGTNGQEYTHDLSGVDVIDIEAALDKESKDLKGQSHTILTAEHGNVIIDDQCQLDASSVRIFKDFIKRRDTLGKYHPYSITALSNFAFVLNYGGHVEKARKLWQEVVWRREKVLGHDHPDTLTARENLVFSRNSTIDKKVEVLRNVYESRLRSLGETHVETIAAMLALGMMLTEKLAINPETKAAGQGTTAIKQGDNEIDKGIKMVERVFRLRRDMLSQGEEDPETLRAEANLAIVLFQKGGPEEAEVIQRDILQKCERVLGDNHEQTIEAIERLAKTCSQRRRYTEAKKLLHRAAGLRRRALGENHTDPETSENLLAAVTKEEAAFKWASEPPAISWQTVPILRVVLAGFFETTKFFLENGATPNNKPDQKMLPLLGAATNADVEMVKLLLAHGFDPNDHLPGAFTPIALAVHRGHHSLIPILLPKMTDRSGSGNLRYGGTLLHQAAKLGHTECVRELLDGQLDPVALDQRGLSPLHVAVLQGHVAPLRRLLDSTTFIPVAKNDGSTLLHLAAGQGYVHMIELIAAKEKSISTKDKFGRLPLHVAASKGDVEFLDALISISLNGSDRSDPGKTNYKTVVEASLLDGRTALFLASEMGHEKVVKRLAEFYGAQIDTESIRGITPLLAAAERGKVEVVKLLVESGADLSRVSLEGRSVLHCALRAGNLDLVEYLLSLKHGLSLEQKDKKGEDGLSYAASGACIEVVRRVLKDYSVLEMENSTVWSPIHWACRSGSLEVVKLLIDAGCKGYAVTTPRSSYPWCPLSIAAFHQNEHIFPPDERKMELNDENKKTYDSLRKMTLPDTKFMKGLKAPAFCDTCVHDIYGPVYQCKVCPDYSLCFMCKETAAQTHPDHSWTVLNDESMQNLEK